MRIFGRTGGRDEFEINIVLGEDVAILLGDLPVAAVFARARLERDAANARGGEERRPPAPNPPSFLRGDRDRSVGSAMARGLSALLSAVEEPNAV